MKKIVVAVLLAGILLSGCTKASRASFSKGFQSGNGEMTRHITLTNARTGEVFWDFTGKANIANAENGEYEIMVFDENGEIRRILFKSDWLIFFAEEL